MAALQDGAEAAANAASASPSLSSAALQDFADEAVAGGVGHRPDDARPGELGILFLRHEPVDHLGAERLADVELGARRARAVDAELVELDVVRHQPVHEEQRAGEMLRAGRDHGAVAIADLAFGQKPRLDLRRQEPAADEVEHHVLPDRRDDRPGRWP